MNKMVPLAKAESSVKSVTTGMFPLEKCQILSKEEFFFQKKVDFVPDLLNLQMGSC